MIDALNETGQRERTIVIFTSDNGSFTAWRPSGEYPGLNGRFFATKVPP